MGSAYGARDWGPATSSGCAGGSSSTTAPTSTPRQKDDHILLEWNESYWERGKPYLDQVRYRVILDDSVKVSALKAGELDLIDYMQPKDVASLKSDANLSVVGVPSLAVWWFWLNATKPPFDNKALWQAFAYTIDMDLLPVDTATQISDTVAKN